MKFGILSLVTAAGLAVSAGTASAHPPGHAHGYGRPVVVAPGYSGYSGYGYGSNYNSNYNSGFGLTLGGPRVIVTFGSGPVYPSYTYPNYGYPSSGYPSYGYTPRPYYGGFYGPRW